MPQEKPVIWKRIEELFEDLKQYQFNLDYRNHITLQKLESKIQEMQSIVTGFGGAPNSTFYGQLKTIRGTLDNFETEALHREKQLNSRIDIFRECLEAFIVLERTSA